MNNDAGLERLLRATAMSDDDGADDCLDPETLAAWCERTLDPDAQVRAEAHASRCERCQAMLAAMAQTAPIDAAAAAGSPSRVRTWTMMLGPAFAAAAAVALWFAVEPGSSPLEPPPAAPFASSSPAAKASGDAAAKLVEPSPRIQALTREADELARQAEARARGASELKKEVATNNAEKDVTLRAERTVTSAAPAPPPPSPGVSVDQLRRAAAEKPLTASETVNVTAETPVVQTSQAQVSQTQTPQAAPQQSQTQIAAARADKQQTAAFRDAAAAGRAGGGAGRGAVVSGGRLSVAEFAATTLGFAVPNDSMRWRIAADRIVQQSTDGGTTWATHYAAGAEIILVSGSAPSRQVCWIVGRAGVILRTSDGKTWQRVPFPDAIDLSSIVAVDARTAVVVTADGRNLTTRDGGVTWGPK